MGVDFASVLTKNRGYIGAMRALALRLLAGLTVVALTSLSAAQAQTATPPPAPPAGSRLPAS